MTALCFGPVQANLWNHTDTRVTGIQLTGGCAGTFIQAQYIHL